MKKLIGDKVDFKKVKVFKRQNSYDAQNEEFGDIDDADAIKVNFNRIRRSLDPVKKREIFNVKVADCLPHRLEKDIMAQSVTDSLGATGFKKEKKKGKRSSGFESDFKRQTGSSGFNKT